MQQPRAKLKEFKLIARQGDQDAAVKLLNYSVACGHERLSIRRYFVARALGAKDLACFRHHCRASAAGMTADTLLKIARSATQHIAHVKEVHEMTAELISSAEPLFLPYEDVRPRLKGDPRFCGRGTCVIGRTKIGANAVLGPGVVIRADGHFVEIGDDFAIGQNSTVHIAHGVLPTFIGNRVTVGRNAVVHACTVGDDCIIDDDAVVLDGSVLESNIIVEPGSIVFPRSTLRSGYVYGGCPAKPLREIDSGERDERTRNVREAIATSVCMPCSSQAEDPNIYPDTCFVAANAEISGRVELRARASVFFSCQLRAGNSSIVVGQNTNIQDNTVIECSDNGVTIGDDTTIGHNVFIHDCRVGNRSLVGIGSLLSNGTIIEDDVLLAAGSVTLANQRLESGWIWGGRPARPMAKLDTTKRNMMSEIIGHYCSYGNAYRILQNDPAQPKGGLHGTPDHGRRDGTTR